jgi:transcriptional regulator with XRE-family HTH domain
MNTAVARKLDLMKERAGLNQIDIAQLLGARPETVSRWNQGKAYPQRSKERILLELEYMVDQLADFYEPTEARQWIFSRQKLLNGKSPAEMIQNGEIDEVLRFVNQIRDAVHF